MTITLHYLNHSRAARIVWLLEELSLKYETKVYYRDPKTRLAPPELKKVHPSGKSPLLTDNGKTYAESALIIDYLLAKYGKDSSLSPKNFDEELEIRGHEYASESNIVIYTMYIGLSNIAKDRLPWGISAFFSYVSGVVTNFGPKPQVLAALTELQSTIDKNNGYIVDGRLTAADIMYETTVQMVQMFALPDLNEKFPGIAAWRKRLSDRPAYQKALKLRKEWDHGDNKQDSKL